MDNKINEVKRFNDLLIKAGTIIEGLKDAGTDIDKIISLANNNGYDFSAEDVEKIKNELLENKLKEEGNVGGAVVGGVVGAVVVVGVVVVI